jgi:hypothetical protein
MGGLVEVLRLHGSAARDTGRLQNHSSAGTEGHDSHAEAVPPNAVTRTYSYSYSRLEGRTAIMIHKKGRG